MNFKYLYKQIVSLINDNYLFIGDQKKLWIKNVNMYDKIINNVSEEDGVNIINKLLFTLEDPHTQFHIASNVHDFYDIDFLITKDKFTILPNVLGYEGDLVGAELLKVNSIDIHVIYNEFKNTMKNFPLGMIKENFIKYIKTSYTLDELIITAKKDNTIILENIKKRSLEELKKMYNSNSNSNSKLPTINPVFFNQISKDILLIKIFSFRFKNISDYIIKNRDLISSSKILVFDIRGNRGGYVNEAKNLLSLIINKDIDLGYKILSKNGLEDESEKVYHNQDIMFSNKHFFILSDEYTMSSAEFIFLKGLKICYPNTTIIGEQTAGLSGQAKIFHLDEKCTLQVTTKKYMDQNNKEIKYGINPDLKIEIEPHLIINNDDECMETVKLLCDKLIKKGD